MWKTVIRDFILLGFGIWGFVHEALSTAPRNMILGICMVMMGFPAGAMLHWFGRSDVESPSPPPRQDASTPQ